MEGEYKAHRALCQACQALHLATEQQQRRAAEHLWVTDETPVGYEPDARMAARG